MDEQVTPHGDHRLPGVFTSLAVVVVGTGGDGDLAPISTGCCPQAT